MLSVISAIFVLQSNNRKEFIEKIKNKKIWPWIICFMLGFILSMGSSVKFGEKVLFNINYPQFIQLLLSFFRATGRFIWLPCYIIFAASMYIVFKYSNKKTANTIIVICLILQLIDFYPSMNNKFNYEEKEHKIDNAWKQILENTEHIVYLSFGEDSFDEMRTAYYKIAYIAYKNNCTLNNFYFAREINNAYETSQKYTEELKQGQLRNGYTYIIKQNSQSKWWDDKLEYYKLDEYIVIISSNN